MAAEINARREEGDLKENGGYHAAREEQGKQEARIRQLQELLRTAQVGDAPTTTGVAGPGMVVTVRFDDDDESETFLIGSREESASTWRSTRPRRRWARRWTGRRSARPARTRRPTARP